MELGKVIYLCVIHTICAYTDMRERRIKNCWTAAVLLGAAVLSVFCGDAHFVIEAGKTALAFFLVLFPLYCIRAIGAGDVKLLCVTGLYIGREGIGVFLVWLLIAAGSMSLIKLLYYRTFNNRLRYFLEYIKRIAMTGEVEEYGIPEAETETLSLALPVLAGVIVWGIWYVLLK